MSANGGKPLIRWSRAFTIAAVIVAGPVIFYEYLTMGALTIDVIAPRLRLSGEGAAALLAAGAVLATVLMARFIRFLSGRPNF